MENKYKILKTTYFDKFKCSAKNCKISCCNFNWKISIDKNTFETYKNIKNFNKFLNKCITVNNNKNGDYDFARIIFNNKISKLNYLKVNEDNTKNYELEFIDIKNCPFQTNDNLCYIHKNLNENYLGSTCRNFPKNHYKFNDIFEYSLNCGCEEVSKLLFNEKNSIIFELIESDNLLTNDIIDVNMINEHLSLFETIRSICIYILQLNQYSIENRMILLVFFMSVIYEKSELGLDYIYEFIEEFPNNLKNYESLFEIHTIKHDIFLKIVLVNITNYYKTNGNFHTTKNLLNIYQKLKNCFSTEEKIELISFEMKDYEKYIFNKIDIENKDCLKIFSNGNIISEQYLKYKNNTENIMKDKQYYIENILVNTFFNNKYPLSNEKEEPFFEHIKNACIKFTISYCIYKGLLIGAMGDYKNFDEDLLHTICTIWGRICSDSSYSLNYLKDFLKAENLTSFSDLIVLIKSC